MNPAWNLDKILADKQLKVDGWAKKLKEELGKNRFSIYLAKPV
jgi:hypothetical protein